jgi:Cellulase (glycosyl hydrolase family 5)
VYPSQYVGSTVNPMCGSLTPETEAKLQAAQDAMTGGPDRQLLAMKQHWRANTVRFQVSQGALMYENQNPGQPQVYTAMVLSVVRQARRMGLITVVSMQAEGYSCTPLVSGHLQKLPDQLTVAAWSQLTPALGTDPGVILEVFNEPRTDIQCAPATQSWTSWALGCGSNPQEGMETVGTALRRQAPADVLLFDADTDAGSFEGFMPPTGMPADSAYAIHPFFYVNAQGNPANWDARFGSLEASPASGGLGQALLVSAWNESANCSPVANQQDIANQLINSYLPGHDTGVLLFAWDAPEAPLVSPAGDPVDSVTNVCSFTGASLAFNQFWTEAGSGVPAPDVDVSSITRSAGVVDAVRLAMGQNGSQDGGIAPQVVSSVNLLVQQAGSGTPVWVARMTVSTSAPWTNGSLSIATASGLASISPTAGSGDVLVFRVRYQGDTAFHDTRYTVP